MTVLELKNYIYENSKIEFILTKLGCQKVKYHENKDYYSATQPDGDNPNGVVINNSPYLNYRSYSRNIGLDENKDLINLVEDVCEKDFIGAIKYLHKILDLQYRITKPVKHDNRAKDVIFNCFQRFKNSNFTNVKELEFLQNEILNDYVPLLYIGWLREGIMPWTAKKFGLQYSYRRKRVIIPLRYWQTGELLGINARTTVENYEAFGIKKYFITPSYPKGLNLYGLYENKKSIKDAGYVVVYEAEKSVLKRDSLGDSTGVSLQGHSISDEQIAILNGLNVDIIFALDKDISQNEVRFLCEKFYYNRHKNIYYIYDSEGLLKDKESPADTTNKKFKQLMNSKIKYDETEHRQFEKEFNKVKKVG